MHEVAFDLVAKKFFFSLTANLISSTYARTLETGRVLFGLAAENYSLTAG